ncbi:MAG: sigma 54-interacting transcriptional regulator [Sandaracinus sp.]
MALDETTLATDGEAPRALALVVLHGDSPRVVPVADAPLVIGRSAPSHVVIEAPTLSREHLRVERRTDGAQGVVVTDLGSKNGVHVRGERVEAAKLEVSESFEAGGITMLVTATKPPSRERRAGEVTLPALLEAIGQELARQRITGRPFTVAVLERGVEARRIRPIDRRAYVGDSLVGWLFPELEPADVLRALDPGERRVGLVSSRSANGAAELMASARRAWGRGEIGDLAPASPPSPEPVAQSAAFTETMALAARFAASDRPVLVTGETGSGKEIVARTVHARSARHAKPFVALNCGAIPATLLESTLFGHERGAFTGATERRKGAFEEADGGTLFLDEVGELPTPAQAALLRVLETGTLRRVGGAQEIAVDVRLVAATHRDLAHEAKEGRFRTDLFHRIRVLVIEVPPLRERPEDVVALAHAFARQAAERAGQPPLPLEPDAIQALLAHDWPGNVRELRNVVERAVLLATGPRLTIADVAQRPTALAPAPEAPVPASERWNLRARLRDFESELIVSALEASSGNQVLAARLLDLPRRTLVHKIAKLGIRRRWAR